MNKSRTQIDDAVRSIVPFDRLERAHQAHALAWILSAEPVYRRDNPTHHLVSYFVPFDVEAQSVLLFYHRKSGLVLPPGGHLEPGESPLDTARREMNEELGHLPTFYPWCDERPMFITATQTTSATPHLDVSLWFVVKQALVADIWYDKREFSGYEWVNLAQLDQPNPIYDPEMYRFARKLATLMARLERS